MASTGSAFDAVAILGLFTVGIAITGYAFLSRGLRRAGGQVQTAWCGLADLLVSVVLASALGGLVLKNALSTGPEPAMTVKQVLGSSLLFASIVFSIGAFLHFRGFRLWEIFGFRRVAAFRAIGWALLLLFMTLPLVLVVSQIMQSLTHNEGGEQELVEVFRAAAQRGDVKLMLAVLVAGVVVAPVCEEALFRGYFYAVGKRFGGPWVSGVVTSLLFAFFHGNINALPGLVTLAAALAFAYERTGSLAVPMTMHALFNGTSLTILYLQATGHFSG